MARISGIDLPVQKRVVISLQYIYGIGRKTAHNICEEAKIDLATRTKDLTEDQTRKIREIIEAQLKVEGDLRQAPDGFGLLSRVAASQRPSRSRSANPYQCEDAQGSEARRAACETGSCSSSQII
jgi:Ribosomal protein S13/S18